MDELKRARLIQEHMSRGDVIAINMWRKTPNSVELSELKSIAYMGLVSAANAWEGYCKKNDYDEERIEFFTPYVVRRMQGAILDELRKSDWLSKTQRAQVKKIQAAAGTVEGVSLQKLAELTGLSETEVRTSLAGITTKRPVSLDAGDGLDLEVQDSAHSQLMDFLAQAVASLDPIEQVIVALYYYQDIAIPKLAEVFGAQPKDIKKIKDEAVGTIYEALVHALPTLT